MQPFSDISVELVEQTIEDQSVLLDQLLEDGLSSLSDASISLNAIVGTPNLKTMHIQRVINKRKVIVLIDIGSTHNFLDMTLIQNCKLVFQKNMPIQVRVANGEVLTSEGKVTDVPLELQRTEFTADFFTLPLGGCHVVLSIQWLLTLKPILWDFNKLTMSFHFNAKFIQL